MKLKVCYIEKKQQTVPTLPMLKGQFFETICIGSGVGGQQVTDLPRLKNGNKSVDQQRIEQQAARFPQILDAHKMKVKETQVYLETKFEGGIILNGTLDFTSPIWDPAEGPIPEAMIDLKLTGNIRSDFGPFSWAKPQRIDHTQAVMYTVLYEECRSKTVPFYYMVFDYKPVPEYKMVKKNVGILEKNGLRDYINRTVDKVDFHEGKGYFTNGSYDNCKGCPLIGQCPDAVTVKSIITI